MAGFQERPIKASAGLTEALDSQELYRKSSVSFLEALHYVMMIALIV